MCSFRISQLHKSSGIGMSSSSNPSSLFPNHFLFGIMSVMQSIVHSLYGAPVGSGVGMMIDVGAFDGLKLGERVVGPLDGLSLGVLDGPCEGV